MSPYTFTISRRTVRWTLVLVVAALATAFLVGRPDGARAASVSGELQLKGPGSTYVKNGTAVLVVRSGGTATYYVKVVNRGPSLAQFKVKTVNERAVPTVKLLSGTTDVTALSSSTDGVTTAPIAPGAYATYKLTTTVPATADPTVAYGVTILLTSTTDVSIGRSRAGTVVQAPTKGTTAWDEFVRVGYGPFVGGSHNTSAIAPPVPLGKTTAFTIRLQNDSATPGTIGLHAKSDGCASAFPITVKDGSSDVTTAVIAGSYVTPVLPAGQHKDLSVTMAAVGNPRCGAGFYDMESLQGASGPVKVTQVIAVYLAAS